MHDLIKNIYVKIKTKLIISKPHDKTQEKMGKCPFQKNNLVFFPTSQTN